MSPAASSPAAMSPAAINPAAINPAASSPAASSPAAMSPAAINPAASSPATAAAPSPEPLMKSPDCWDDGWEHGWEEPQDEPLSSHAHEGPNAAAASLPPPTFDEADYETSSEGEDVDEQESISESISEAPASSAEVSAEVDRERYMLPERVAKISASPSPHMSPEPNLVATVMAKTHLFFKVVSSNLEQALERFAAFFTAPTFATRASSDKVDRERNMSPERVANISASPSPDASTVVGTKLTCIPNDGPDSLPPAPPGGFPVPVISAPFTFAGDSSNSGDEFYRFQMHFPGSLLALDGRSDAKCPESECCVAMAIAWATGKRLASNFVERTGGIYETNNSMSAQSRFRDDLNVCNWRLGDLICCEVCFYDDDAEYNLTDCALGTDCTDSGPRTYASTSVGTELACNLNDGPKSLDCIWAADSPLDRERFLAAAPMAGGLMAYIIECGPLRGNHGSCSNSASCPYLSTAVGGTGLYRNPDGKSTIDPRAIFHHATCTGAERNSTTADGLCKGARMVFEIALEELFIKGKIGDADGKNSFPYDQTNANEDTACEPAENSADSDGVPWNRVECFDLAFVLLGLTSFVWAICALSRRRSGPNERFANQTQFNQRFALALLVLLVPRTAVTTSTGLLSALANTGVGRIVFVPAGSPPGEDICLETCFCADGDDGGSSSEFPVCAYGADCANCSRASLADAYGPAQIYWNGVSVATSASMHFPLPSRASLADAYGPAQIYWNGVSVATSASMHFPLPSRASLTDTSGPAQIYWNGASVATTSSMRFPLPMSRSNLYVGKSHSAGDPMFTGQMKDLLVWDVALSPAQLDGVRL
ncbi:hypothetical protein Ctob_000596, partial [Chrysochromulina tobinii]